MIAPVSLVVLTFPLRAAPMVSDVSVPARCAACSERFPVTITGPVFPPAVTVPLKSLLTAGVMPTAGTPTIRSWTVPLTVSDPARFPLIAASPVRFPVTLMVPVGGQISVEGECQPLRSPVTGDRPADIGDCDLLAAAAEVSVLPDPARR